MIHPIQCAPNVHPGTYTHVHPMCTLVYTHATTAILNPYKTKKRAVKGLYPLQRVIQTKNSRREWDLNPRMTVLQTVALGHLAIPPVGLLREQYTRCGRRCQGEIKEILIFYDGEADAGTFIGSLG